SAPLERAGVSASATWSRSAVTPSSVLKSCRPSRISRRRPAMQLDWVGRRRRSFMRRVQRSGEGVRLRRSLQVEPWDGDTIRSLRKQKAPRMHGMHGGATKACKTPVTSSLAYVQLLSEYTWEESRRGLGSVRWERHPEPGQRLFFSGRLRGMMG